MLEDDTLSTYRSDKNAHSYHSRIEEETRRSAFRAARWDWLAENFCSNHSVEYWTEGEFVHQVLRPTLGAA